jgi:superoxide reductase
LLPVESLWYLIAAANNSNPIFVTNHKPQDMPRVFTATNIAQEDKEVKRDYLDRHMPHVEAPKEVQAGEKFAVKVRLGDQYPHPDDFDHYISTIQLWNRETLLAEIRYTAGANGNKPGHVEVDLHIVAPEVSMNLTAMAVCTKHGLWQSEGCPVKVTGKKSAG